MQELRHVLFAAVHAGAWDTEKKESVPIREVEGSCMYGPEEAEEQSSFRALELLSRMQPVLVSVIFREPDLS